MNARFEGSFLGDASRIAADAVLECKICWYGYDPAAGDDARQVPPGTPFTALPDDWRCPQCDGARDQFMVVDAGSAEPAPTIAEQARLLEAGFREVFQNKMRDTPFVNRSLSVEAVGFRAWGERALGVLVAPWFMNMVVLPAPGEDWSRFAAGEKRVFAFPSGDYEFIANARGHVGPYFACSLFSPMSDFSSQLQATETARAVLAALFDDKARDVGDEAGTIRDLRVSELERQRQAEAARNAAPTRRALITGGLAGATGDAGT